MSESEYDSDSDQEISEKHSELISAVRQLDKGQRIKKLEQCEPSLEISEFSTLKSTAETLDQDALGINAKKIKAKLKSAPLERPAAERIKRTVGFENTKKELGKWVGIVARNRTAACLNFPLSQTSMKLEGTDEYVNRFRIQSELAKKLDELEKKEEQTIEQDQDEFPLTLQEILEQRHQAAKFRAQQSYKAAKAMRQKKIKSKKYHRIQRKEKIKKALKEFEELQKTDPQAALEKLEELDRARAEERMTLRHKSTGQWAKSKQVRAKYDKESRQVLAEQLSISKELTQKVKKDEDSEEEDDENDGTIQLVNGDQENPWMNPVKSQSEIDDFISGYRKYWDKQNKAQKENTQSKISQTESTVNESARKIFQEPEIRDIPRGRNPVEKVIEECVPEMLEPAEERVAKKKKSLQKSSKDKLGLKSTVNKITKSKKSVKAGTSNWSVSPVDTPQVNGQNHDKHCSPQDIDIDEIFDSVEEKLQEKIKTKLDKVKRELEREQKYEKKKRRKDNEKNSEMDDVEKLGLKGQRATKPIVDKPIEETTNSKPNSESSTAVDKMTSISEFNKQVTLRSSKTEIDPNKFINMKPKHIKTALPDELGGGGEEEEALDDDIETEDQYKIISEAFADDDVVDEFRREKEEEIKNSQPEDIDLRLPGWGSWGGKNIKQSLRKKRRFIVKVPKEAPRRDENKGDVVIIEEKCPKIKQHLVNELPFPFSSVQDFEASIRAPLGREFVPEKTFNKLITPHVKTKMGKIIEPMSEDALVKKADGLKKRKRPAAAQGANDKGVGKKKPMEKGKTRAVKRQNSTKKSKASL